MVKEPGLENISPQKMPEHLPEKKDRFIELMERRYHNAAVALGIEKFLSAEISLEDIQMRKKVLEMLEPILTSFSEKGTLRIEEILSSLKSYFYKKAEAREFELSLKKEIEKRGKEPTNQEMGVELFRQRTGESPTGTVFAKREEGYFVLSFFEDDDYLKFLGKGSLNESGGMFHRAMRFSNMSVDVILNRQGFNPRILEHERQHFVNISIFGSFNGIENDIPPSTKLENKFPLLTHYIIDGDSPTHILRQIKDELLARIRDGSDSIDATIFLESSNLYNYLVGDLSRSVREEVDDLLAEIEIALNKILKPAVLYDSLSTLLEERGVLVYQLIDIPLLRFPERIKAISDFYKKTNKV